MTQIEKISEFEYLDKWEELYWLTHSVVHHQLESRLDMSEAITTAKRLLSDITEWHLMNGKLPRVK